MQYTNNINDPRMDRTNAENINVFFAFMAAEAAAKGAERAKALMLGSSV